jgi:Cobalamin-independent synthase, N-terminal domain
VERPYVSARLRAAAIEHVSARQHELPAGDFSVYDQMLDMTAALDPCRRASLRCG